MKKFELTSEFVTFLGKKLFRIKALVSFGDVAEGELGGFIERENNLDQYGDAWVCGNARVYGNAQVSGDARVCGDARVYGDAQVSGDAWVYGDAQVSGDAWVCGNARVCGNAWVSGDARVCGNAWVCGNARVYGDAQACGDAWVQNCRDYSATSCFGSENRTTTFFRTKDGGISVRCGCFYGTLREFREKVKERHGDSRLAKEYLMLADLMEFRLSKDE